MHFTLTLYDAVSGFNSKAIYLFGSKGLRSHGGDFEMD